MNPLHRRMVEIDPVVLEKKMKIWQVYTNRDGRQQTNFKPTAEAKNVNIKKHGKNKPF